MVITIVVVTTTTTTTTIVIIIIIFSMSLMVSFFFKYERWLYRITKEKVIYDVILSWNGDLEQTIYSTLTFPDYKIKRILYILYIIVYKHQRK